MVRYDTQTVLRGPAGLRDQRYGASKKDLSPKERLILRNPAQIRGNSQSNSITMSSCCTMVPSAIWMAFTTAGPGLETVVSIFMASIRNRG